jgi:rhodanese-related sulfurtransferase
MVGREEPIGVEGLLAAAREEIVRVSPSEALKAVREGAVILVDIRPSEQRRRDGDLPGAHNVQRNVLEWRLDPQGEYRDPELADVGLPVILICDEGYQSSLAAAVLRRLGVEAGDVIDGVQGWVGAELPTVRMSGGSTAPMGPENSPS